MSRRDVPCDAADCRRRAAVRHPCGAALCREHDARLGAAHGVETRDGRTLRLWPIAYYEGAAGFVCAHACRVVAESGE